MFLRVLTVLVFSLASSSLFADCNSTPPDNEPSNRVLFQRIQELEKRLTELEDRERKQTEAQTVVADSQPVADRQPPEVSTNAQALHEEHTRTTVQEAAEVHYPS